MEILTDSKVQAAKYLELACNMLVVPIERVVSRGRKQEYCEARQIASYLIKLNTDMGLQDIADFVGYKSHASVWRDQWYVPERIKFEPQFRDKAFPVLKKAEHLSNLIQDELEGIDEFESTMDEVFDFYSEVFIEQTSGSPAYNNFIMESIIKPKLLCTA